MPVWHVAGMHVPPAAQAEHVPLSQTMPLPHDVPFATFVCVPPHVWLPDAHVVVPLTHTLPPGWQAAPATQATQPPPPPTACEPPSVPSGGVPLNGHVA